jgi:hypothetical protein
MKYTSFLSQLYLVVRDGHDDQAATDMIFGLFDDLVREGTMQDIDGIFRDADMTRLPVGAMRTMLVATNPVKGQLVERPGFYTKACAAAGDRAERLFGRLK